MKNSILISIRQGTVEETQLAINMALAASAFEIQLSILFSGNAILQIIKISQEETGLQKQITAWPWYDITNVFIAATDIPEKNLISEDFILPVTPLNPEEINHLISQHTILLSY